jgi:hypothetical protein
MSPYFVRSDPSNFYATTQAGTWIISKKTLRVVGFVPEHPILRANLTALGATIEVFEATQGMEGVDELRTQAAKSMVSFAAAVERTSATEPHQQVVAA